MPDLYLLRAWCGFIRPFYQKWILPCKVNKLRRKEQISVLFVVCELGSWKTENLYLKMLNHPKFSPQLLLLPVVSSPYAYGITKKYLEQKQYSYCTMNQGETIWKKFHPSIIFYQKPYDTIVPYKYFYMFNMSSLFCNVSYCFRNRNIPNRRMPYMDFVWQNYAENDMILKEKYYPKNMVNTGLPFMDILLLDNSHFDDPWHQSPFKKKRIIYAPHHTINTEFVKFNSPFYYATFLDYADFMLEMAIKYEDNVQWAFKPHPLLRSKLYKLWGKEKTDSYYKRWSDMENCQIDEGEYMGLFKHSDAMIHDCGSFKLEYLYTDNPVMYLVKKNPEYDYENWQTTKALELHYKGHNKEDIEQFIQNVIEGIDPLKGERKKFVKSYLTPPNGKSACDNIINAILGESEYA